jgi:hypothetical protein
MPRHEGPIAVHYHGGFLDGHVSRTGVTRPGDYMETWSASSFYFATRGEIGAFKLGVSPEDWKALTVVKAQTGTISLHHLYRVTASRVEDGTLIIDAAYEFAR